MKLVHKESGEVYKFISNFGPWIVVQCLKTKKTLHISPEFMDEYEQVELH